MMSLIRKYGSERTGGLRGLITTQGLRFAHCLIVAGLVSVLLLSSCAKSDSPVDNGRGNSGGNNYNPATGMVRTALVLSVAGGNEMTLTRSSEASVQLPATTDGSNFLGMTDLKLLAMQGLPQDLDFSTAKSYDLAAIAPYTLGNETATPSSRIYDMELPVGTDNLVFYSRVQKSGTGTYADEEQGLIDYQVGDTKDDIGFSLTPKLAAGAAAFNTHAATLEAMLTDILTTVYDDGTIHYEWPAAAASANSVLKPLQTAFRALCLPEGKLRAGSGHALGLQMSALYAAMKEASDNPIYSGGVPGSVEHEVFALGTAIMAKLSSYFTVTDLGGGSYSLELTNTDLRDFPTATGMLLPTGLARYTCTLDAAGVPTVAYVQADGTSAQLAAPVYAPALTTYPAEMCYWCSSPIYTTDQSVTDNDIPKTTEELDRTGYEGQDNHHHEGENMSSGNVEWTSGSEVAETTKGVLMQNNINYGTALLESVVLYTDGNPGVTSVNLTDNRSQFVATAGNATLTVTSPTDLELTGILLVGFPQTVGWDFTAPLSAADYIVFDNHMMNSGISFDGTAVTNSYTMVWDTYTRVKAGTGALTAADLTDEALGQHEVIAVLELVNNLEDFYGSTGLIRKGQHFYLSVEMSPKYRTVYGWPGGTYRYPPLKDDGTGANITRVFIQDFITHATFGISATTLQHATDTPIDPRENGIFPPSLGLSVDLKWGHGMDFDKEL